jgi:hypothetical protein
MGQELDGNSRGLETLRKNMRYFLNYTGMSNNSLI